MTPIDCIHCGERQPEGVADSHCVHCGAELDSSTQPEATGHPVALPNEKLLAPTDPGDAAYASLADAAEAAEARDQADESSAEPISDAHGVGTRILPFASAVGATAVVFGALFAIEQAVGGETAFTAKLLHRGWTPIAAAVLTSWSLALLCVKARRVRDRRRSFGEAMLPSDIALSTPADIEDAIGSLRSRMPDFSDRLLGQRIARGLEQFRVSRNVKEVAEVLQEESDTSYAELDTSYSLERAFLWTIPILGFIGTVMGVGTAIGGFGGMLGGVQEIDMITASLMGVTDQLGVAFDTTLVALVMSVVVMIATSIVEQSDKNALLECDAASRDQLLPRLPVVAAEEDEASDPVVHAIRVLISTLPDAVEQGVGRSLAANVPGIEFWRKEAGELAGSLAASVAVPWQESQHVWDAQFERFRSDAGELYARHQAQFDMIAKQNEELSGVVGASLGHVRELTSQHAASITPLAERFGEIVALQSALVRDLSEATGREGITGVMAEFRRALDDLDPTLRRIADEPIDVNIQFSAGALGVESTRNGGRHAR